MERVGDEGRRKECERVGKSRRGRKSTRVGKKMNLFNIAQRLLTFPAILCHWSIITASHIAERSVP